jgi:hypothetical protein
MTQGPLRDSKSDLLEAARAAIKDREAKAAELAVASQTVPPRRRRRLGVLVTIGAVGLVLLVLQPVWLVGPTTVPPDPVPVAAAGLRVTLLRQRQLVFNYAKAHGRLPASLTEAGDSPSGVSYHRLGDSAFTLVGSAGDSVVVLQSSDSQAVFLGNSLKILRNRGGQ